MGFRFRKSIKAGPLRVNLSKSGVGYSVGTKGLRVTKKAGGGTRTTASIPGTGVSYVSEAGNHKTIATGGKPDPQTSVASPIPVNIDDAVYCGSCYKANPAGTARCIGCGKPLKAAQGNARRGGIGCMGCLTTCLAGLFIFFLLLLILGSCSNGVPDPPAPVPAQPTTLAAEPTHIQAPTSASIDIMDTLEDNKNASTSQTGERTYILNTNSRKFHKTTCSSVEDIATSNRKTYTGTRTELIEQGYSPCGRCNP